MYKISIILPTFNVEKYLKKSFDSILSQTIGFSNLQLIYVDDKSSDGSREIIDEYAKQYENVISIHLSQNSGSAGKPRNEGIKFAFADYVMFLDPDDYLMENACEIFYDKITESNADVVIAGYQTRGWNCHWNPGLDVNESLIEAPSHNLSLFINSPALAAKIFKKETILKNNIKFPEKIPAQDLVFLTEFYLNAKSILTLNKFIAYTYYVRDNENDKSISNDVSKKYLLNLLSAYNLTMDLFSKFNVDIHLREICFSRHLNYFVNQLRRSNLKGIELENFFNNDIFLKIRNRDFILKNNDFNNFFEDLIKDYETVELSRLDNIGNNAENQFINSENFISEKSYQSTGNTCSEEIEIDEIQQELYHILKKTSELTNKIEDNKKLID